MVKRNSFFNFHVYTYFCYRIIGNINTRLSSLKDIILWETWKGTEPGSALISLPPLWGLGAGGHVKIAVLRFSEGIFQVATSIIEP